MTKRKIIPGFNFFFRTSCLFKDFIDLNFASNKKDSQSDDLPKIPSKNIKKS